MADESTLTERLGLDGRSGRVIAAVLALLLVVSAAAAVVLGVRFLGVRAEEQARDSALSAARDYVTTMFGYTPDNVAEHVERSKKMVTGDARAQYEKIIADTDLVAQVGKQRIISEVIIQDAGVVTNTRDTATVLLFINQSVTRGGNELVQINPSRLTYSMRKDDGRWLINSIDVITDDSFRGKVQVTSSVPSGATPIPGLSAAPTTEATPGGSTPAQPSTSAPPSTSAQPSTSGDVP
jgi:Mce-associated membrane protein